MMNYYLSIIAITIIVLAILHYNKKAKTKEISDILFDSLMEDRKRKKIQDFISELEGLGLSNKIKSPTDESKKI